MVDVVQIVAGRQRCDSSGSMPRALCVGRFSVERSSIETALRRLLRSQITKVLTLLRTKQSFIFYAATGMEMGSVSAVAEPTVPTTQLIPYCHMF